MGMTVTITDNDDGTYTVAPSDDDQGGAASAAGGAPAAAASSDDSDQAGGQTVNSIGEALRAARGLLTQDAKSESSSAGGEDPQAAWNEEASKRDQSKQLFGA